MRDDRKLITSFGGEGGHQDASEVELLTFLCFRFLANVPETRIPQITEKLKSGGIVLIGSLLSDDQISPSEADMLYFRFTQIINISKTVTAGLEI